MIRWITERLGTASYYDYEQISDTVDAVVIDVRELVDREGNRADLLMPKIQAVREALLSGKNVVVCCDRGLSRSNAIAAGGLMALGMPYEDAVRLLAERVGISDINLGLLHDMCSLFGNSSREGRKSVANVLVTGSTGFVGRALAKTLQSEYKVFCPSHEDLDLAQNLPLLDLYVNQNDIDFIVHLAHPRLRASTLGMAEAIAMMRNILETCRLNQLGILYLSGLVVFSGRISDSIVQANSSLEPQPRGGYAETKYLCEELIRSYQRNYGLEVTILRPAALYGKDMDRAAFICKFFEAARQGTTIRTHCYRNGPPVFDFLYLDDLIEAIRLTLRARPAAVIHLGTGKGTSTYELAQTIVRICSSTSAIEMVDVDDQTYKVVADVAEARAYLNWESTIDLETGLMELAKWYKAILVR